MFAKILGQWVTYTKSPFLPPDLSPALLGHPTN